MTPSQRAMARHALGLPNDQKRSYRNRYFAPDVSMRAQEWRELVASGLAEEFDEAPSSLSGFFLTREGADMALDPGETLCLEDFPARTMDDLNAAMLSRLSRQVDLARERMAGLRAVVSEAEAVIARELALTLFLRRQMHRVSLGLPLEQVDPALLESYGVTDAHR